MKITTKTHISDEFSIVWKRGPQKDTTKRYGFYAGDNELKLSDQFERTSKFFKNKEGKIQKKTCEFHFKQGNKVISKVTVNLHDQIGVNNLPLDVNFGKGIILKVVFKIIESPNKAKGRAPGSLQIKEGPSDADWNHVNQKEKTQEEIK